jgi:hypothetical protein
VRRRSRFGADSRGLVKRISGRKMGIAEISSELVRRISETESRFEEILDD